MTLKAKKMTMNDTGGACIGMEDDASQHSGDDTDESQSSENEDSDSNSDDLDISHITMNPNDPTSTTIDDETMVPTSESFGPAMFYKKQEYDEVEGEHRPSLCPVHYPKHWWHRGQELRQLTQFEYAALVEIKKIDDEVADDMDTDNADNTKTTKEGKRGRPTSRRFAFQEGHPLCDSHCQYLASKQKTLILTIHPPPFQESHPNCQKMPQGCKNKHINKSFHCGKLKKQTLLPVTTWHCFVHMNIHMEEKIKICQCTTSLGIVSVSGLKKWKTASDSLTDCVLIAWSAMCMVCILTEEKETF